MIECQLHCLYGFLFSYENQKHNKQMTVPFEQRDDVQRFERQG
jgi:hypothetical protein